MTSLRRPSGSTIARAGVLLIFALTVSVLAVGMFIQVELQPIDGRLGLPQRLDFPLCGCSYQLGNEEHWTKAEIGAQVAPGYEPYILEPTIGKIPLADVLTKCPLVPMVGGHGSVAPTVIWLQVGPDDYWTYALEGGP